MLISRDLATGQGKTSNRSYPKNLLSAATLCAPAGEATPQRAIRIIYGSVAVSKVPHLHAGPCGARVPALMVAQVHVVSQLPLQRARFQLPITVILRLMAHYRFDRQILGETLGKFAPCDSDQDLRAYCAFPTTTQTGDLQCSGERSSVTAVNRFPVQQGLSRPCAPVVP